MAKIKGLDKVLKELKTYGEKAEKGIDNATEFVAGTIRDDAKQIAKSKGVFDMGKLIQGIKVEKDKDLNYTIFAGESYSAYVEFGTGAKVNVPAEMQQEASKFRGKGKGNFKTALENIKAWCKRKGIDEKNAYPILVSLLNKGMSPRPFMYPAWLNGRKVYLDELKQLLKELSK